MTAPAARTLTVFCGGRSYLVTAPGPITIGRDPTATVRLTDERGSRRHSVIRLEGDTWLYEDLASTNGSYLDGAHVGRLLIDREFDIRIGNPIDGEIVRIRLGPRPVVAPARRIVVGAIGAVLAAVLLALAAITNVPSMALRLNAASPAPSVDIPSPTRTPALTEKVLTTSDVAAIGRAATVLIVQGDLLGSGVYLGANIVLTAAHVVPTTAPIVVSFDDRRIGTARIVRLDSNDDLALLSVSGLDAAGARPITWGDSMSLREGDQLVALGYPLGLPFTVKVGVVSGLRQDRDTGTNLIQTDAAINPGMSGGAVLDARARLVGINDWGYRNYAGLNFAVASSTARAFVEGQR